MLQETKLRGSLSRLYDSQAVYGWVSILLHWFATIIVVTLWFIGKSIFNGPSDETDSMRQLHVSIATSTWLVLIIRIIWRLRSGHPHVKGLTVLVHRMAKFTHYAMLFTLLVMLTSGPLVVWSSGHSISVFGWFAIPGPIGESESIQTAVWFIHSNAAMILLFLFLAHIGGALKHLMFHSDDAIVRMLWPGRQSKSVADQ